MTERKIKLNSIDDVKEFTSLVNGLAFDADVISGRYAVDAKSIMGIFSLDLTKELTLKLHCDDADCRDFLDDAKKFLTD